MKIMIDLNTLQSNFFILRFIKKNITVSEDMDFDNLYKEHTELKRDYDTLKKKYDEACKELEQYKSQMIIN